MDARSAPLRSSTGSLDGKSAPAALLCALLLMPCGPAPARASTSERATAVVSHYLEATGGREARDAERTLHLEGRIKTAGLEGRWEMWLAGPDRWMRSYRLGPLRMREGFDGTVAWRTDATDRAPQILDQAETRHAREDGWFHNEQWSLADHGGGSLDVGSSAFINGTRYDVLRVTSPGGEVRELFVDTGSGRLDRINGSDDHRGYSERLSDYKRIGGRFRATRFTSPTLLESDAPIEFLTVDSVRVNVVIPPERFAVPPVPGRAIAWGKTPGAVRVPFVYAAHAVVVKASIDGHPPVDFILDTGASTTAIDRDYALDIGLELRGEVEVQGISASDGMAFARVRTLGLSGGGARSATLRDFQVGVIDFGRSGEMGMWRRTHGLLGADFLSHFVVQIDYDSSRITLSDPQGWKPDPAAAAIPFELSHGIPVVELTVDDGCTGKFLVDVGNAFQFVVHNSMVEPCGLLRSLHGTHVEVFGGGVGGGFRATLCRLDSVRIGPFSWPDPVAVLSVTRHGMLGSEDYAGNIGNTVLERFRCTFDYSRRVLYLEPGARYGQRDGTTRFGAMLARVGETVYAGSVLSGSAAYEAGLRWFDEIVAIDDKPLGQWTREEIERVLERGQAGAVHHVRYRRFDAEKTVEVTLRDAL